MMLLKVPRIDFLAGALLLLGWLLWAGPSQAQPTCASASPEDPVVQFDTNLGSFQVELFCSNTEPDLSDTINNFLQYVEDGAYTTTGFIHRSVDVGIFVVQGGGFYIDGQIMRAVDIRDPVPLQAALSNVRGTIAMARTDAPNSATSQWFINVQDNPGLNPGPGQDGFAVFGEVLDPGMTVVDDIASQTIWALNGSVLSETPLISYPNDGSYPVPFLVYVTNVQVVSPPGGTGEEPVPEPGLAAQLLPGCAVLIGLHRRRRKRLA